MVIGDCFFDQAAYDDLGMFQIHGVGNVHILPVSVPSGAVVGLCDDVRIFGGKPGRDSVSRGAYDYGYAVSGGGLQHSVQACEIKDALPGFPCAPCGFGNADHVNVGLFHHFHVSFDSVTGQIFIVICRPE